MDQNFSTEPGAAIAWTDDGTLTRDGPSDGGRSHVTNPDTATEIERNGFIDGQGYYGFNLEEPMHGVFLSDTILDANEGAWGEIALAVEIDEQLIADREIPEAGRNYREWFVPAELLNARASISRV